MAAGFEFDFAPAWRPEEGDILTGVLTDLDKGYSNYSPDGYPILTLTRSDGERFAIHAFHTALRNRLSDMRPHLGDELSIRYNGVKESKGGAEYHSYSVKGPVRQTEFWGVRETPSGRQSGMQSSGHDAPDPDEEIPF